MMHQGRKCLGDEGNLFPGRQVTIKDGLENKPFDAIRFDGIGCKVNGHSLKMSTVIERESLNKRVLLRAHVNAGGGHRTGASVTCSVDEEHLVALGKGFPENVSLAGCRLMSLPPGLSSIITFPLQAVQKLCLVDNMLKDLPDDFATAFPELRWLDLSGNSFEKFPAALKDSAWLEEVVLLRNPSLCEKTWLFGMESFAASPPPKMKAIRVDFACVSTASRKLMLALAERTVQRSTSICIALDRQGLGDADLSDLVPLLLEAFKHRQLRGCWPEGSGPSGSDNLVLEIHGHPLKLVTLEASDRAACDICGELSSGAKALGYRCDPFGGKGGEEGEDKAGASEKLALEGPPLPASPQEMQAIDDDDEQSDDDDSDDDDGPASFIGFLGRMLGMPRRRKPKPRRGSRLKVGARVKLSKRFRDFADGVSDPSGCLRPGAVGTIIFDDQSDNLPFKVKAESGATHWYAEGALEEVVGKTTSENTCGFYGCQSCVQFLAGSGHDYSRHIDARGQKIEFKLVSNGLSLRISDGFAATQADQTVEAIEWDSSRQVVIAGNSARKFEFQLEHWTRQGLETLWMVAGRASSPSVQLSGLQLDACAQKDRNVAAAEPMSVLDLRGNHITGLPPGFEQKVAAFGGTILLSSSPSGNTSQQTAMEVDRNDVVTSDETSTQVDGYLMERGIEVFRFCGELKHGAEHSKGTRTYADGCTLETTWTDGKRNGSGMAIWRDGETVKEKWKVEFRNDEVAGVASGEMANGSRYEGAVKEVVLPYAPREVRIAIPHSGCLHLVYVPLLYVLFLHLFLPPPHPSSLLPPSRGLHGIVTDV